MTASRPPDYLCTQCQTSLVKTAHSHGFSWLCAACEGMAATIPLLRRHAGPKFVAALWAGLQSATQRSARRCPSCLAAMRLFVVRAEGATTDALTSAQLEVELDGCVACQLVWFDPSELARLRIELAPRAPRDVRAGELARAKVALMAAQARENSAAEEEADKIREILGLLRRLMRRGLWR